MGQSVVLLADDRTGGPIDAPASVRERYSGIRIECLTVTRPAEDDDNVWFLRRPGIDDDGVGTAGTLGAGPRS